MNLDTVLRIRLLPFVALPAFLLWISNEAAANDSLRYKIGQMIIVGFSGSTIPDSLQADLLQRNLGGVLLTTSNCPSPSAALGLTNQLKASANTAPFIAVDEEGGYVARLNASNGFASSYSHYTLGTRFNISDSTRKQSAIFASWVTQCGMNLNLAPVVDVNVNPNCPIIGALERSFSAFPQTVYHHAQIFVDEFHAQRLYTALKHFPGHGSSTTDSHFNLPDITTTWADSELVPYRRLIESRSVDVVMVGHLFNAKIDSVLPSSLSYNTITGLLRDSLQYGGVVMSDDLYSMKAISGRYTFGETILYGVNAGMDVFLYVSNIYNKNSLARLFVDTVETMVCSGKIAGQRIDESYNRIITLKKKYLATGFANARQNVPAGFAVENYPNPFNPSTTIRFSVPQADRISVRIFDMLGHEVETLFDGDASAGSHELLWNAGRYSSGVYFCRLQSSRLFMTQKLVLVK